MDAVGHPSVFSGQLRPVTCQITQITDWTWRNETAAQQAALQQMGKPLRVGDISLASGNFLEVARVDQKQGEESIQDIPDGLPQDTSGLHGNMRHAQSLQVVGQRSQIPGHCPEGADLGEQFPGRLATADSTLNGPEMDIKSSYLGQQGVHDAPSLQEAAAGDVAELNILLRVLLDPRGQQFRVRGDIRARLLCGLDRSSEVSASFSAAASAIIPTLSPIFIIPGCRRAA